MAAFGSVFRTCRVLGAALRCDGPRRLQALAVCSIALLASGAAATGAAYYMTEPSKQRPPAITGDGLGLPGDTRPGDPRKYDRPVRLADSDAWIDSLRTGSHWKREKSEPERASRDRTQERSRSARALGAHRLSRASHALTAPSRRSYRHQEGTTYRTVCVRLCDGFFWPISFATTKANLKRDSETCQNTCGSPVALYHYTNPGGGPEDMVDLDGRSYARLSSAFLYRTTYEPSCKCRAHPWEQEALERHVSYANSAGAGNSDGRTSDGRTAE